MKNKIKYLVILSLIILCGGCSRLSKSDLVENENTPQICKMALECMYYQQAGDKGTCSQFIDACQKTLIYNTCAQQEKDYNDGKVTKNYYPDKCWNMLR